MKINLTKLFDWSIAGIQAPYQINLPNGQVEYRVEIEYWHHGRCTKVFRSTRGGFSASMAHAEAMLFYNQKLQEYKERLGKTK